MYQEKFSYCVDRSKNDKFNEQMDLQVIGYLKKAAVISVPSVWGELQTYLSVRFVTIRVVIFLGTLNASSASPLVQDVTSRNVSPVWIPCIPPLKASAPLNAPPIQVFHSQV